jgi:hypothetical protein
MLVLGLSPKHFFRRLVAHIRAWQWPHRAPRPFSGAPYLHFPSNMASIHREVTANGVRVFSLCGECGVRLQASATLCDECAQKRSRPARPY